MKTKLLLFFMLISCCFLFGQSNRYDTIRYARQHYQKRLQAFKKESMTMGRVVLLGNSITEFGDWKKLLHDSTLINRGIAGDNTFGILDRLDEIISLMPSKLFVEAGINDISQNIPVDSIIKNIFLLARRVKMKSSQTELYVYSVLPTNDNVKNDYPDAYNKNHIVMSLNRKLQNGAEQYEYTYIDLIKIFSDANGKLNTKFADEDGLHLNNAGYEALANVQRRKGYLK